jgi:hypothetical protein
MGCDQGGGFEDCKGRGGANIIQDGAVDAQHMIRAEGNVH